MNTLQTDPKMPNGQVPFAVPARSAALSMTAFGIDGLQLSDRVTPSPAAIEVLIQVHAAALNYLDVLVVDGIFNNQLPLPHIPGTDVAGTVVAVGSAVTRWQVGDAVVPAFIRNWKSSEPGPEELRYDLRSSLGMQGYFAEFLAVAEDEVVAKPSHLSFTEAATLPIAGIAAYNEVKYAQLQPGQTLLTYGIGGVSRFALQFERMRGLRVIIVGTGTDALARMRELGAERTLDYQTQLDWPQQVLALTGGRGVDGVFDNVGGANLNKSIEVLKFRGRLPFIGLIEGFSAQLEMAKAMWKQQVLIGLECGSVADTAEMAQAMEVNGIHPLIDKIFPISQVQAAFRYLKSGQHVGKVVFQF